MVFPFDNVLLRPHITSVKILSYFNVLVLPANKFFVVSIPYPPLPTIVHLRSAEVLSEVSIKVRIRRAGNNDIRIQLHAQGR